MNMQAIEAGQQLGSAFAIALTVIGVIILLAFFLTIIQIVLLSAIRNEVRRNRNILDEISSYANDIRTAVVFRSNAPQKNYDLNNYSNKNQN